jgi:putative NIF3 family GTP cyclohydrolase 1 type 2
MMLPTILLIMMPSIRSFCLVALGIASNLGAQSQPSRPTAAEVIERIKKNVGVPWPESTVDTFKAGDPNARVTGIAVTMMATLDVLERAAARGDNLIITHEPTFYSHLDSTAGLASENDPVYAAKTAFIRKHGLIIWRFHDTWHQRKPDGILTGVVKALHWETFQQSGNPQVFNLPPTTLGALTASIRNRLGPRALRFVGDPSARISRVALSPGFAGGDANRRLFQGAGIDALIIGEAHEWETIEYASDAIAAKQRKGLIIIGHIPSEQAGMEEAARWLTTFVKDVRVDFIPTREPFSVMR